jgi:hypothetical protein
LQLASKLAEKTIFRSEKKVLKPLVLSPRPQLLTKKETTTRLPHMQMNDSKTSKKISLETSFKGNPVNIKERKRAN